MMIFIANIFNELRFSFKQYSDSLKELNPQYLKLRSWRIIFRKRYFSNKIGTEIVEYSCGLRCMVMSQ
jgi:hypothetical protein